MKKAVFPTLKHPVDIPKRELPFDLSFDYKKIRLIYQDDFDWFSYTIQEFIKYLNEMKKFKTLDGKFFISQISKVRPYVYIMLYNCIDKKLLNGFNEIFNFFVRENKEIFSTNTDWNSKILHTPLFILCKLYWDKYQKNKKKLLLGKKPKKTFRQLNWTMRSSMIENIFDCKHLNYIECDPWGIISQNPFFKPSAIKKKYFVWYPKYYNYCTKEDKDTIMALILCNKKGEMFCESLLIYNILPYLINMNENEKYSTESECNKFKKTFKENIPAMRRLSRYGCKLITYISIFIVIFFI